jgi:hypothetical protein
LPDEDKQMVTREAARNWKLPALKHAHELQSAAATVMEEFKARWKCRWIFRSPTPMQRIMSSLDALDAENRAACDARRRAIETEVAQATQHSTEQFRSGMKAFYTRAWWQR